MKYIIPGIIGAVLALIGMSAQQQHEIRELETRVSMLLSLHEFEHDKGDSLWTATREGKDFFWVDSGETLADYEYDADVNLTRGYAWPEQHGDRGEQALIRGHAITPELISRNGLRPVTFPAKQQYRTGELGIRHPVNPQPIAPIEGRKRFPAVPVPCSVCGKPMPEDNHHSEHDPQTGITTYQHIECLTDEEREQLEAARQGKFLLPVEPGEGQ